MIGLLKGLGIAFGVILLLMLAWALLLPIVLTGKLIQQEQVSIDLAGQTPVSVTFHPCGSVGGIAGEAVDGKVSTRFPVCGEVSKVSLQFKDFTAVCSMASMDDVYANDIPWRFRIVDRKCELTSY